MPLTFDHDYKLQVQHTTFNQTLELTQFIKFTEEILE